MKIFCTASKDTYITNKIIDSSYKAVDANVGQAGTLDLFKIYDENKLDGVDEQTELSRILIKFDIQKLDALKDGTIDINHPSFKAELCLFDVRSGHAVPKNFNIVSLPLAINFDEGVGKDVSSFGDLDVANFVSASYDGSIVLWNADGANALGTLGGSSLDAFDSGNLGSGLVSLFSSQFFEKGTEDLRLDVTEVVSGTLAGIIDDHGFRISFDDSEESDDRTRFLKRFASRHSSNPFLRPRLEISFDDSLADDRGGAYFDSTNRLFLRNIIRGELRNLQSGSSTITGNNCAKLEISRGDFVQQFNVSQLRAGTNDELVDGTYYADAIVYLNNYFDNPIVVPSPVAGITFAQQFANERVVTFQERWKSLDGNLVYHTGTIEVKFPERNALYGDDLTGYLVSSFNLRKEYDAGCLETVRLFVDNYKKEVFKTRKTSIKKRSEILDSLHYRIKDAESGFVVFDFDVDGNSTKTSYDVDGHYFNFDFGILPPGRTYRFEFLVDLNGQKKIIEDEVAFRIA